MRVVDNIALDHEEWQKTMGREKGTTSNYVQYKTEVQDVVITFAQGRSSGGQVLLNLLKLAEKFLSSLA